MTEGLRAKAIRLLTQRERSRFELARKLAEHAPAPDVEQLLDELERTGLLSDERFAEAFVASRVRRWGVVRLRAELRLRGVAAETAESALSAVHADESTRAMEVWRRRFGELADDPGEAARQMRFLRQRGFSAEVAHRIVRAPSE